jgi:SAM-dependent methyltransferase
MWFKDWFNTSYYHLLYDHRDESEAETFMDNLITYLNIEPKAKILDLGCGKGRHSHYLSNKGYEVTGIDLSEESIAAASEILKPNLSFKVGDMREDFDIKPQDYIFNLFTSFGYFDIESQNIQVLTNVYNNLNTNGVAVFDYMNTLNPTLINLGRDEVTKNGVLFRTNKFIENRCICKLIEITDGLKNFSFRERVKLYDKNWWIENLKSVGFEIIAIKGAYDLSELNDENSNRAIFIVRKIN